jgi:hypothetical protein
MSETPNKPHPGERKRDTGHPHWLEYIKVIGGLVLAAIALLQYKAQGHEQRAAAVLSAMQLTQQGRGTTTLRRTISELVTELYATYPDLDSDLSLAQQTTPEGQVARSKLQQHIERTLLRPGDLRFANALAFLESMYEYGRTDPCAWFVVSTAYARDAGAIIYWFGPELEAFFDRQNRPKGSDLYLQYLQWRTINGRSYACDLS